VGLLLYGAEEVRSGIRERQELASQSVSFAGRVKEWFARHF
jgi:hypothetical protein